MNKRAAFTLVELLAVLVITGLLAGLLFPLAMRARVSAWRAVSTSSLRQLTTANLLYAADNKRFVPTGNQLNTLRWSGKRIAGGNSFDPTKGLLADYLGKSQQVTACPMLTHIIEGQDDTASFEKDGGGYGYNDYLGGSIREDYTDDTRKLYIPLLATRVGNPGRTIMFATTALARSSGVQEYPFCHPPFWVNPSGSVSSSRPSASMHFRYNGKAIVSWCDGHVTLESKGARSDGFNPYGGNASAQDLGWFGPDKDNGFWNPDYTP